eukprot:jgi/Chrzof1/13818/Cz08g13160.t1
MPVTRSQNTLRAQQLGTLPAQAGVNLARDLQRTPSDTASAAQRQRTAADATAVQLPAEIWSCIGQKLLEVDRITPVDAVAMDVANMALVCRASNSSLRDIWMAFTATCEAIVPAMPAEIASELGLQQTNPSLQWLEVKSNLLPAWTPPTYHFGKKLVLHTASTMSLASMRIMRIGLCMDATSSMFLLTAAQGGGDPLDEQVVAAVSSEFTATAYTQLRAGIPATTPKDVPYAVMLAVHRYKHLSKPWHYTASQARRQLSLTPADLCALRYHEVQNFLALFNKVEGEVTMMKVYPCADVLILARRKYGSALVLDATQKRNKAIAKKRQLTKAANQVAVHIVSEYHARKSAIRTALQQQGITLDLPKKKTARHSLVRQYIKTGKDCEGGQVDLDTVVIAAVERHFLRLHGYYRPLVYGRFSTVITTFNVSGRDPSHYVPGYKLEAQSIQSSLVVLVDIPGLACSGLTNLPLFCCHHDELLGELDALRVSAVGFDWQSSMLKETHLPASLRGRAKAAWTWSHARDNAAELARLQEVVAKWDPAREAREEAMVHHGPGWVHHGPGYAFPDDADDANDAPNHADEPLNLANAAPNAEDGVAVDTE